MRGSISSENSPLFPAWSSACPKSCSASSRDPAVANASTSQKVQGRKAPSRAEAPLNR